METFSFAASLKTVAQGNKPGMKYFIQQLPNGKRTVNNVEPFRFSVCRQSNCIGTSY